MSPTREQIVRAQATGAAQKLSNARYDLDLALRTAKMIGANLVTEHGWTETDAATAVGIDRMTLRKALGK